MSRNLETLKEGGEKQARAVLVLLGGIFRGREERAREHRDAATLCGVVRDRQRWRRGGFKVLLYVRNECPFGIFQTASEKIKIIFQCFLDVRLLLLLNVTPSGGCGERSVKS